MTPHYHPGARGLKLMEAAYSYGSFTAYKNPMRIAAWRLQSQGYFVPDRINKSVFYLTEEGVSFIQKKKEAA